ncbi:MAG: beta-N-acetylhexosaminidase [Prolixibacteraceae bacterium]|nr:beta-N-acetylhexosaminidase [Prolixibacteraceae bacterium]
MKSTLLFCFCLALISFSCKTNNSTSKETELSLIPKPDSISYLNQEFKVEGNLSFKTLDINVPVDFIVDVLKEKLAVKYNITLSKSEKPELQFIGVTGMSPESYSLTINKNGIVIKASDYNGFLYGVQTLMQIADASDYLSGKIVLPGVDIYDSPAFRWRGMHLDVCRHFFKVDFIKKVLRGMAMHKLNNFHWHLTDDQGWRIEIKKYPELASIAAWRDETIIGHIDDKPWKFDGKRYGGYYTQEEIKDVVNYAKQLGITVVPEIEMPGHAVAALTAYPQFSCTGGPIKPFNVWGVSDDVFCAGKEETFTFLEDVLSEVMELFPGEIIHIGGDECPKGKWEKCPDCQKRIKDEGLKNEQELQSYLVKRIEKFVNSHGKKIIGWDEILEGGLADNALVMSWRGEEGGIEAAESGHEVVMSPNDICYFDHYQVDGPNEPLAFKGLTTIEDVYKWSIIPEKLSEDKIHFIRGAQANVWSEYIPDENQAEYMIFPRLCALSEITWTNKENLDYEDFMERLAFHYKRLENAGFNYKRP